MHQLQPHRLGTFKRPKDLAFAAKLEDFVGLYIAPPAYAQGVSIDEKSQIPALHRTHSGLALKAGTFTHDCIHHGTTMLFAALNVLDGTVLGRCMQRHRHQEFIRFLKAIERTVPPEGDPHVGLTTMPPTSTRRSVSGVRTTGAGCSTSPRLATPG